MIIHRLAFFRCVFFIASVTTLSTAFAAGGYDVDLFSADINLQDKVSLQKGAQVYMNHCLGCHGLKYLRYERMANDLGISVEAVKQNLIFDGSNIGDPILSAMPEEQAKQWFGVVPPDLTLQARLKGADWLYSYLISFYPDPERIWGVNNRIFADVGMPHVLEDMQEALGDEAFFASMRDLTQFLVYAAEPARLERERIGRYVLLFLALLMIPVYFLNKEYWKDVK